MVNIIKQANEIQKDITSRFEERIQNQIAAGSTIDLYNVAISETLQDVYQEIENNKTPHIWSSLEGWKLDDTGTMFNLPRKTGESDANYKYRLQRWLLSNEASNTTAIQNALLAPFEYVSNVDYHPYTKGTGTGTCYIIPKSYDTETINNAFIEISTIVKEIASPSLYVEYIIPTIKGVKLQIYISSIDGDLDTIKDNLETKISEYINKIAPGDYLEVGEINRMGINENNVDYFNVTALLIDNVVTSDIRVLQTIDSKMLYDEIIWAEDSNV